MIHALFVIFVDSASNVLARLFAIRRIRLKLKPGSLSFAANYVARRAFQGRAGPKVLRVIIILADA